MARILRPGLVAIRYIGKIDTLFRGAVEGRKYITVEPNDIVLLSLVDSITYCRGTQWEKVETEVDISRMLNLPLLDSNEPSVLGMKYTEATLENLNNLTDAEIKKACKKYGIKIGRTKTEDLIPLLLPFLQQNQD